MIGTTIAMALALQSAEEGVVAVRPNDPQTWVLEYPVIIRPLVREYYDCLQSGLKVIDGKRDFESQHQADIPRCEEQGEELLAEAKAIVASSKRPGQATDAELDKVFETLRQIHVARGKDIDMQVAMRLVERTNYQEVEVNEEPTGEVEPTDAESAGQ